MKVPLTKVARLTLFIAIGLAIYIAGAVMLVSRHVLTWKEVGAYTAGAVAPISFLSGFVEKKQNKWEAKAEEQRKAEEAARTALAAKVLADKEIAEQTLREAQEGARAERQHIHDALEQNTAGLKAIVREVRGLATDVREIKKEYTSNDGSTQRDRIEKVALDVALTMAIGRTNTTLARIIWRRDKHGVLRAEDPTPQFLELTGLTADECNDGGWAQVIRDDTKRAEVQAEARKARDAGSRFVAHYECTNAKTGKVTCVVHQGEPVKSPNGEIDVWLMTLRMEVEAHEHRRAGDEVKAV